MPPAESRVITKRFLPIKPPPDTSRPVQAACRRPGLVAKQAGGHSCPCPVTCTLDTHMQHWERGARMDSSSWECRPNLGGETRVCMVPGRIIHGPLSLLLFCF